MGGTALPFAATSFLSQETSVPQSPAPVTECGELGGQSRSPGEQRQGWLCTGKTPPPPPAQLVLSAHTVRRRPEVNPQTGVRRVQRMSERGLVFRIDKEVSEVSMNQKSNKNTDKGFNRCFPKDDDSSESLGQQGDQTS